MAYPNDFGNLKLVLKQSIAMDAKRKVKNSMQNAKLVQVACERSEHGFLDQSKSLII